MSDSIKDEYPSREDHHSHRLTRLLFTTNAAAEIGQAATLLVIHVAHAEDHFRYRGPVKFWNSQLTEALGVSNDTLNKARKAAKSAGWLSYDRANDRKQGIYFTTIPGDVLSFPDTSSGVCVDASENQMHPKIRRIRASKSDASVHPNQSPTNPNPTPVSLLVSSSKEIFENLSLDEIGRETKLLMRSVGSRMQHDRKHLEFLWQVAAVALAIEPDMLFDFNTSLSDWDIKGTGVRKPRAWLKAAIERQCANAGHEWESMRTQVPKLDPQKIPLDATDEKELEDLRQRFIVRYRNQQTREEIDAMWPSHAEHHKQSMRWLTSSPRPMHNPNSRVAQPGEFAYTYSPTGMEL